MPSAWLCAPPASAATIDGALLHAAASAYAARAEPLALPPCSSTFARASRRCPCPAATYPPLVRPPPVDAAQLRRPATRRRSASHRAVLLPDARPARRDDADRAGQSVASCFNDSASLLRWALPLQLLRAICDSTSACSAERGVRGTTTARAGSQRPAGITPVYSWTSPRRLPTAPGPRGAECKVYMASNIVFVAQEPPSSMRRRSSAAPRKLLAGLLTAINDAEVRRLPSARSARRWSLLARLACWGRGLDTARGRCSRGSSASPSATTTFPALSRGAL